MRILVMTNLFPNPYQRSRATFNRQQVARLAAEHELVVIAPIPWTDEVLAMARSGRLLDGDRRSSCGAIEVHHPAYYFPPKVCRGWYGRCFRKSVQKTFRSVVRDFRCDLVFAPWAYPDGWAAVELGHDAGLPVVVKVHGSDLHALDSFPKRIQGTREALAGADAVVAVSGDLGRRAEGLGVDPARIRVVYDGIDPALFHPGSATAARDRLGLPVEGRIVLFVGNLVEVKGLRCLVRAVERLAIAGERFTCLLVGKGPLAGPLRRLLRRKDLDEFVRLVGPVAHDTLGDWYRAADFCVLPSRAEGLPVVLLECAACDRPFVASRTGGIPEIAHFSPSLLVPPDDPAALADAMHRALAGDFPGRGWRPATRTHDEAARELVDLFRHVEGRWRTPSLARATS